MGTSCAFDCAIELAPALLLLFVQRPDDDEHRKGLNLAHLSEATITLYTLLSHHVTSLTAEER